MSINITYLRLWGEKWATGSTRQTSILRLQKHWARLSVCQLVSTIWLRGLVEREGHRPGHKKWFDRRFIPIPVTVPKMLRLRNCYHSNYDAVFYFTIIVSNYYNEALSELDSSARTWGAWEQVELCNHGPAEQRRLHHETASITLLSV
jgi:hypothetical protein